MDSSSPFKLNDGKSKEKKYERKYKSGSVRPKKLEIPKKEEMFSKFDITKKEESPSKLAKG